MPPSKITPPASEERQHKPTVQRSSSSIAVQTAPGVGSPNSLDIMQMNPTQVLSLQRSIGNQGVQRMLESARPAPVALQATPVVQREEWDEDEFSEEEAEDQAFDAPGPEEEEGGEQEGEEERYQPSARELRKEMGLGKRLGWKAAYRGAQVGDFVANRFRRKKRNSLTAKVGRGVVNTAVKARNRLYEKHELQGLSKNEKREYYREQREFRREQRRFDKERERPDMINF